VNISERTLNNYQGQLDLLIDEISDKKNQGYKIVILSGTRARGERLVGTLRDRGIESSYKDTVDNIQYGEVVITFGNQLLAGHKRDYLDIVYDKGDKLYVPVDQLDLIQKYVGSEGKSPKVNKLGSAEWQKAKAKVRKSINEIAEDLVKLYAMRTTVK
ncbi:CarD family transcriptional regulator, partial [Clostridium paraputrificum]|uniref:CarD family transcriptional regulator n=1 Tax=Clostridium paraputrificum TaxID=29363 RepID=UPI000AF3C226